MSSTAEKIVSGLGGRDNISDLEPCITRLRVEVEDQEKVDEDALRAAGAFGVVRSGRVVQVVVGPTADDLASEIAALRMKRLLQWVATARSLRRTAAPERSGALSPAASSRQGHPSRPRDRPPRLSSRHD